MAETLAEAGHDVTILFTEQYFIGEWGEWEEHYKKKNVKIFRLWDDFLAANQNLEVGNGCATRACTRSYR